MDEIIEYTQINKSIQDDINQLIIDNVNKLDISTFMDANSRKRIINSKIRNSKSTSIKNDKVINLLYKLIKQLNKIESRFYFKINDNDIKYIEYEEGGFFTKHQDYTNLNHKIINECTLLICLESNCEGGETVFYKNQNSYCSSTPKTKYGCCIFNKNLIHEGLILKSGIKKILQINLFAISTTIPENYIIIKFKNQLQVDLNKYIIYNKITLETFFHNATKYNFMKNLLNQKNKIFIYCEKNWNNYWKKVYKMLNKPQDCEYSFHPVIPKGFYN